MKELFTIDLQDYNSLSEYYIRPSSRAIIIKDQKVALVYSKKYDYYKFPGGGIKKGETNIEALIREVKEETGLVVIENTICEFGKVLRIQKTDDDKIFYQENYYYLCNVLDNLTMQSLDDYEKEEEFVLVYVEPIIAINKNYQHQDTLFRKTMIDRDAKVLEILLEEKVVE